MKQFSLIKKSAIAASVALAVWLLWPSLESTPDVVKIVKTTPHKVSVMPSKTQTNISSKSTPVTVAKVAAQQSAVIVAKAYAAELSFPPYSQPLKEVDFDRLNPNYFNPQTIPIDDDGGEITAALTQYRYTYPEEIVASLDGENIDNGSLEIIDLDTDKIIVKSSFEYINEQWQASIDGRRDFPEQLQANVISQVNGKEIIVALSLKYVDSIATLESFDPADHQNADMVITANIHTREKGLYRLRANLFDANNEPIAYLTAKDKLSTGRETLALKVHKSVLQGRMAPFHLSTFTLELMSSAPGSPKKYGNSTLSKYVIDDFAISSLDDIKYEPTPQERQRLELLNKISEGQ